ncbi:MAG: hypothetical protein KDC26_12040 [Armatimonadetes bacterium]|nr:hypothetical protein [Armatimonadota bacterium]
MRFLTSTYSRLVPIFLAILTFCSLAWAQDGTVDDPESKIIGKPDVFIQVTPVEGGPDTIKITIPFQDFDVANLEAMCNGIGAYLNSEVRGLSVYGPGTGTSANLYFPQASFAVYHVISREDKGIDFNALIKPIMTVEPRFKSFSVIIDGMAPEFNTVKSVTLDSVMVRGSAIENPAALEYRIMVLTSDLATLDIPRLSEVQQTTTTAPSKPTSPGLPKIVFVLIGLSVVSLFALVYFALRSAARR